MTTTAGHRVRRCLPGPVPPHRRSAHREKFFAMGSQQIAEICTQTENSSLQWAVNRLQRSALRQRIALCNGQSTDCRDLHSDREQLFAIGSQQMAEICAHSDREVLFAMVSQQIMIQKRKEKKRKKKEKKKKVLCVCD